jgi:hypothetical protein
MRVIEAVGDAVARAIKCSKSPLVTELEYIEPWCTVLAPGLHHDHFLGARVGEKSFLIASEGISLIAERTPYRGPICG